MAGGHTFSKPSRLTYESINDALPFPSQTQTDYGEDISELIMNFREPIRETEPHELTQSASDATGPPSSTSSSLKRKFGSSSNTSLSTLENRLIKKPKVDEPAPAPYIIAFSEFIQERTDLPYGVLFEIARLLSCGVLTYEQISADHLNKLNGNNVQSAPETGRTLRPETTSSVNTDPAFAQENAVTSPWEQLDIEEDALSQDPYAGLGHSQLFPGWYGGKVGFKGKLDRIKGSYKVVLERCTLGPSYRFARRYGSKNFLRIRVPKKILYIPENGLDKFFLKPFVLWGNVFRSFYAKDGNVFMFRTNELMVDGEAMTKWSARTALGLSNSVPGPILDAKDILDEDDIISSEGSDMTDGCGSTTRSTTMEVFRIASPDTWPTAFQFRLQGAKGMLIEKSETSTTEPLKVWLRPSQIKIRYPPGHHDPLDPSLRIIDLLRTSYMRSPGRISAETIINLAENGVPHAIFVHLLRTNLAEVVNGLTIWEGPEAMYNLWTNVERAGAVVFSRRAREAAGEARARGYGEGWTEEADDEDEDDEDGMKFDIALAQGSAAWWADQTSGCPSSLEETVLVLLDAGFRPELSPILREKLKQVVTTRVKNMTIKYRYELPLSAIAFVVPDPYSVLGTDEIHVKSSRRNLKSQDGLQTDIVLGQVLLTRNPCKLPTDVRKVQAVENPLLRSYTDVIVCSVQGHRRLLDFLAGGDYDGDTATVIWDAEIVKHFQNADEKYSKEPDGLETCFTSDDNETVDKFIKATSSLPPLVQTLKIQKYLLGALRDTSVVGKYSAMHDAAIYHLGYSHPRTIRLAYKFCKVLDAPKTGLKIKSATLTSDLIKYNDSRGPEWKQKKPKSDSKYDCPSNAPFTRRGKNEFITGHFIMDVLSNQAKKERDRTLAQMEEIFKPLEELSDPHLTQPWVDAVEMAKRGSPELARAKQMDLSKIAEHVQTMFRMHRSDINKTFTNQAIESRQDILRNLSKRFAASPSPDELMTFTDAASISRLRASYAYLYDLEQKKRSLGWSRFPWDVALRELCHIKASALGPCKTVTTGFYERFKLSRR
ncbi:hypothetical protein D9615_006104 [Tricholomella constricta]|uniref:RNA-dependent RNA polymerase n=1 Tax=Tricholomella constricta TaxID=117010 RepID=A0A8H5M499_9AGAR|nr:hypothetical protein D9615_006104 [Tricholomella constricta]